MGTIVERRGKSGTKFKAQVIKKKDGKIALSKSATFERKSTASAWMRRIEKEYEQGRLLQKPTQTTVGELIDMVVKSHRKELGKTKKQVLTTITRFDVADYEVSSLKTSDLIEFATQVAEGAHGQRARTPSTCKTRSNNGPQKRLLSAVVAE